VRIDIRRIESLKDGQTFIGNRVRCKVVKNKVAAPFRQAEFDILFMPDLHGINRHGDILDLAVEYDVIKKLGSFYSYGDLRLGQGRMNSATYLREHEELSDEIEAQVRTAAGLEESPATAHAPEEMPDAEAEAEASADAPVEAEATQLAIDA
jgi:recombination protein RecA